MITTINPEQQDNVALMNVDVDMLARVCTNPCTAPTLHILLNEFPRYVLASHLCSMKVNYSLKLVDEVEQIAKILSTPHATIHSVPLYIEDKCCGEFNIEGIRPGNSARVVQVDIRRSWSYVLPDVMEDITVGVVSNKERNIPSEIQSRIVVSHRGVDRAILDPRCLLVSY